ncbi:hypothetical protein MFIFM68171_05782 [Madurella fahalii]|uniref:Uncharacterized protein n=1 Tax=Madurella fahalii TaxID=1157608 RepID=A0ABQ0GCT2_9PEZI
MKRAGKSFFKWTPWLGIVSLTTMLACTVASAIVVAASHDKEVGSWKIQPAVWLAIFSAISNIAFSSALATGIAVCFWLRAELGSELSQLHYIWDHGRGIGFLSAFRAGSDARKVALLATAAYIVQFASGPLLQRATYQVTEDRVNQGVMFLDISNRIPDGWYGTWNSRGGVIQRRPSITAAQEWYRNDTVTVPDQEGYRCDGTCHGHVRGAGFVETCVSSTRPLDLSTNASNVDNKPPVFLITSSIMDNGTNPDGTQQHLVNLTVMYITEIQAQCQATLHIDNCYLSSAVVEYPVSIQNTSLALRTNDLDSLRYVSSYSSWGDRLDAPAGTGVGPLAILNDFINDFYHSNDTAVYNTNLNRWIFSGPGKGHLGDIFLQTKPPASLAGSEFEACRLIWSSPTRYLLTAVHDYMFRVAHHVGNGTDRQTFAARRTATVLVFRSDRAFLGGALGVALSGILLVGSLSWGWWRLGRAVTLSPLETARVFQAPAVRDAVRRGETIDEILENVRHVRVSAAAGGEDATPVFFFSESDLGPEPRRPQGMMLHGSAGSVASSAREVGGSLRS